VSATRHVALEASSDVRSKPRRDFLLPSGLLDLGESPLQPELTDEREDGERERDHRHDQRKRIH
jgi:hypothetical protein